MFLCSRIRALYRISLVIRQSLFPSKNLDLSYKMDPYLWDCLRKGETHIRVKFHRTDLVICSYPREGKTK